MLYDYDVLNYKLLFIPVITLCFLGDSHWDVLWGMALFLKKVFLVVTLNTQTKTTKLTDPTLQPSRPTKNFLDFLLCLVGWTYKLPL